MSNGSFEPRPSGLLTPGGGGAESVTPPAEQQPSSSPSLVQRIGRAVGGAIRDPSGFNRNLNQHQMKFPRVQNAMQNFSDNQQISNHFRHAGMGAAIRFAVGAPQYSEQVGNLYRAQAAKNMAGDNPGYLEGLHQDNEGASPSEEFGG
jgi:hypothetical protein